MSSDSSESASITSGSIFCVLIIVVVGEYACRKSVKYGIDTIDSALGDVPDDFSNLNLECSRIPILFLKNRFFWYQVP